MEADVSEVDIYSGAKKKPAVIVVDGDGIHYTTGRTRDEEEEEDGGREVGRERINWVGGGGPQLCQEEGSGDEIE